MKTSSLITLIITQCVSAVIGLAVAFGLDLTPEQMAAIMTAAGVVGGLVGLILWSTTVDRSQVVERLIGDHVVAGEANDMVPAGQEVRKASRPGAVGGEV